MPDSSFLESAKTWLRENKRPLQTAAGGATVGGILGSLTADDPLVGLMVGGAAGGGLGAAAGSDFAARKAAEWQEWLARHINERTNGTAKLPPPKAQEASRDYSVSELLNSPYVTMGAAGASAGGLIGGAVAGLRGATATPQGFQVAPGALKALGRGGLKGAGFGGLALPALTWGLSSLLSREPKKEPTVKSGSTEPKQSKLAELLNLAPPKPEDIKAADRAAGYGLAGGVLGATAGGAYGYAKGRAHDYSNRGAIRFQMAKPRTLSSTLGHARHKGALGFLLGAGLSHLLPQP